MIYALLGLVFLLSGTWVWIFLQGRKWGKEREELSSLRGLASSQAQLLSALGRIIDEKEGNVRDVAKKVEAASTPADLARVYNEVLSGTRSPSKLG